MKIVLYEVAQKKQEHLNSLAERQLLLCMKICGDFNFGRRLILCQCCCREGGMDRLTPNIDQDGVKIAAHA